MEKEDLFRGLLCTNSNTFITKFGWVNSERFCSPCLLIMLIFRFPFEFVSTITISSHHVVVLISFVLILLTFKIIRKSVKFHVFTLYGCIVYSSNHITLIYLCWFYPRSYCWEWKEVRRSFSSRLCFCQAQPHLRLPVYSQFPTTQPPVRVSKKLYSVSFTAGKLKMEDWKTSSPF